MTFALTPGQQAKHREDTKTVSPSRVTKACHACREFKPVSGGKWIRATNKFETTKFFCATCWEKKCSKQSQPQG